VKTPECPREADVLEALQTSAWPDCSPAELRAHVDECPSCAGVVEVASALLGEQNDAVAEACVPTAASVWWRMRLRARREATASAMRPIAALQGIALACGVGLLLMVIGVATPALRRVAAWAAGTAPAPMGASAVLTVVFAAVLVVVVAPVALYLANRE
jgi:hypothetical protein